MNAALQFLASYSNIIDLCLLNSLVAYALFLSLSANMFSLATGGFMALGAYCSVYMTMELGFPFATAPPLAEQPQKWATGAQSNDPRNRPRPPSTVARRRADVAGRRPSQPAGGD